MNIKKINDATELSVWNSVLNSVRTSVWLSVGISTKGSVRDYFKQK